jgi:hypothetical protein
LVNKQNLFNPVIPHIQTELSTSTMKNKLTAKRWFLSAILISFCVLGTLAFMIPSKETESSAKEKEISATKTEFRKGKIDEKADKILKEMSENLAALKKFSFTSRGYYEVYVDSVVKKIQITNMGKLSLQKPDKLKVEREGEKADLEMYLNNGQFTLYGTKNNMYATASTGADLDKTVDYLKENLGIYLPAGDLLYSDVYKTLTQDVVSSAYVGQSMAGDVLCDHLAFSAKEVDWQIWVEAGENKLPRRYVITSRKEEGMPEYAIEISEWNTKPKLKDKLFVFNPPSGAVKIDFLTHKDIQTRKPEKK